MSKTDPKKPDFHEHRCRKEVYKCLKKFKKLPQKKQEFFKKQSTGSLQKLAKQLQTDSEGRVKSIVTSSVRRAKGHPISDEEIEAAKEESIFLLKLTYNAIQVKDLFTHRDVQKVISGAIKFEHTWFFVNLGKWIDSEWNQNLRKLDNAGDQMSESQAEELVKKTRGKAPKNESNAKIQFRLILRYLWTRGGHLMSGDALVYYFARWKRVDLGQIMNWEISSDYAEDQIQKKNLGLTRGKKKFCSNS